MKRMVWLVVGVSLCLAGCSEGICRDKGYREGTVAWDQCVDHYDTLIGDALAGMGAAGARD